MAKIYSYTVPIKADIVDAFCVLQKGFTDQFVYYDKENPQRAMGLGRCIALSSLKEADQILQGPEHVAPVFFSFNRFDAENPKNPDEMMQTFPRLHLMLPEVTLIENEKGSFLQVNSLGPVYKGRVDRFVRHALEAKKRERRTIPYTLIPDELKDWEGVMELSLNYIHEGRIDKLVPSRRQKLVAQSPFSSKDLLVNLIDGSACGKVFLYRYGDVFFCGCTPELLVRKKGNVASSMCLAGTASVGETIEDTACLAEQLLNDEKNLREHAYVVHFIREVFSRNCFDVDIPEGPSILTLKHVQHLYTPVQAHVMEGRTITSLASQLHPTPALAGSPVGEALMCLREVESYNRGFFGGVVGFVDGDGDGEFAVAIRSGVFDGECGWVYAGCGVVDGSDAQSEFNEIDMKLKTILSAFQGEE